MAIRIPFEYQEVEWIGSDGNQYIDTGVVRNTTKYKRYTEFQLTSTSSPQSIAGTAIPSAANDILQVYANNLSVHWSNSTDFALSSVNANKHTVEQTWNNGTGNVVFDGVITTKSYTHVSATVSEYLFAYNNNGTASQKASVKISCHQIWKNDELVRNLVPCYRKSDGKAGMYCIVANTFFSNLGTGNFTVGADVKRVDRTFQDGVVGSTNVIEGRYINTNKEFVVTEEIINKGAFTNGSHTILTGQQNDSDGFTLVGRRNYAISATKYINQYVSWSYLIDLTDYNEIVFYAKKNADHGGIMVCVANKLSDTYDSKLAGVDINYGDAPTSWTKYSLDVSAITGEKYIVFIGGYGDQTGDTSSSTSYCDIRFV